MSHNDPDHHDVFPGGRAGKQATKPCPGVVAWLQISGLLLRRGKHFHGKCPVCHTEVKTKVAPKLGTKCKGLVA